MAQRRVVITEQSDPYMIIVDFDEFRRNHRFIPVEAIFAEEFKNSHANLANLWLSHSDAFEEVWFRGGFSDDTVR